MAYFAFPGKYRWIWLLIASFGYYLSFILLFLGLLMCIVIVNFFLAQWLEKVALEKIRGALALIIPKRNRFIFYGFFGVTKI
ncbi:MAG: hypothetical protein WCN92_09025 [Eubacteriales bacterium]